jgi:hypothetical protein
MSQLQISYPQLPRTRAISQLAENARFQPEELQRLSEELCSREDHSYLVPSSANMNPLDLQKISVRIEGIHSEIAKLEIPGTREQLIEFDRRVTKEILEVFPLDLYQASMKSVWSYITLRCLPGIAAWRFPNKANHPDFERYLGHERNTFQRLWFRAHLLGSDLAVSLAENDLIQMFERGKTIGSNRLILRTLAEEALARRSELEAIGGKTSDFISESAKIIKRELVVVNISAMGDDDQKAFIREKTEKALAGLKAVRPGKG